MEGHEGHDPKWCREVGGVQVHFNPAGGSVSSLSDWLQLSRLTDEGLICQENYRDMWAGVGIFLASEHKHTALCRSYRAAGLKVRKAVAGC